MIQLSARKVMTHYLRTIRPDVTVVDAAKELYDYDIGSLVVTEYEEGTPIRIVTTSAVNMVVAEGKTPTDISVEEIMSIPLISVTTGDTVRFEIPRENPNG